MFCLNLMVWSDPDPAYESLFQNDSCCIYTVFSLVIQCFFGSGHGFSEDSDQDPDNLTNKYCPC